MGDWLDALLKYWPLLAGFVTLLALWFRTLGTIDKNKDLLESALAIHKQSLDSLQKQVNKGDERFEEHHKNGAERYNMLNSRMDLLVKSLTEHVDKRFDALTERIDKVFEK